MAPLGATDIQVLKDHPLVRPGPQYVEVELPCWSTTIVTLRFRTLPSKISNNKRRVLLGAGPGRQDSGNSNSDGFPQLVL
ncbi:hypothetical protein EJB05_56911, partial [Eragrostis curvula]